MLLHVEQVFARAGDVAQIIMGLDKAKRTPCGFCFVVYNTRKDAEDAVKYVGGLTLDDRPVRVDFDWGFEEGRQYGRGRGGGQVAPALQTFDDARLLSNCSQQSSLAAAPAPQHHQINPTCRAGICHVQRSMASPCHPKEQLRLPCLEHAPAAIAVHAEWGHLGDVTRSASLPLEQAAAHASTPSSLPCQGCTSAQGAAVPPDQPVKQRQLVLHECMYAHACPSDGMLSSRTRPACARGYFGVQVRDEYRTDWDAGRGGYGNIVKQELTRRQEAITANMGMYEQGQEAEADHPVHKRRRTSSDSDDD